jgi:uncharacterized protein (TIGR03067 family)
MLAIGLILAAAVPAFAQTKPPAVPRALVPFQGTWVLSGPSGQPLTQDGELVITVTGDKYAQSVAGAVNERGSIKLDATKKPMWIDLHIAEGNDAGKIQLGLVDIKGDTMTGVLKVPGDTTRPASLAPAEGVISFIAKKKVK